jgi:hypothetical protein
VQTVRKLRERRFRRGIGSDGEPVQARRFRETGERFRETGERFRETGERFRETGERLAAGDLARERQVDDGAAGVQLVRAGLDRPGVG